MGSGKKGNKRILSPIKKIAEGTSEVHQESIESPEVF
jgi:hypothetical protein